MAEPVPSDDELLRRYSHAGDRAAMDELARRHIDFVYASARRQLGDADHAKDVTQAVFLLLMRKAGSIRRGHLAGWLFNTTRYAAANARKMRARRDYHERRAAGQKGETSMPGEPIEMDALMVVLDDALAALGGRDREALILRYLKGREVAEVGAVLGMSEGTCRRRINRAVERLRKYFGGRGITALEAGAVVVALQSAAVEKAPAGVTIAASTTAAAIASGAATSIVVAKLKIAAIVLVALTLGVSVTQAIIGRGAGPMPVASSIDVRQTVRLMGAALTDGNSAAARALAVGTERDLELLDALAAPVAASDALNQAMADRYRDAEPSLRMNMDWGFFNWAGDAAFDVQGDTATMRGPRALRLRRIEGVWKVDASHMIELDRWKGSMVFATGTEEQLSEVKILADVAMAQQRLNTLALAKLGPANTPFVRISTLEDWPSRAQAAALDVQEDVAELRTTERPKPIRLRRVDGRWRVDLVNFGPDEPDASAAMTSVLATLKQMHSEIAAGEFTNRTEAVTALRERIQPALLALGGTTQPAATMPSIDHNDPRSVMRAYSNAIASGDSNTARELAFGPEQDMAIIDLLTGVFHASVKLDRMVDAKLGRAPSPRFVLPIRSKLAYDKAQLQMVGDVAELIDPDNGSKLRLQRFESGWKIDMADYASNAGKRMAIVCRTMIEVLDELCAEVEAGQYTMRLEVATTLPKVMDEAVEKLPPTTQSQTP